LEDDKPRLIEQVSNRAREMQAARAPATPHSADKAGANQMGLGLRMSIDLVAAVAVGAGIGIGLDRWLGTAPWFMLVFLPAGFVAGVFNVARVAAAADRIRTESESGSGSGGNPAGPKEK
jgi:ATP synthase protein I